MLDPYTPTATESQPLIRRRAVRRYFALTAILLPIAASASFPGVTLLNQEYGWYPAQSGIYDIEVNGRSVSNASVIRFSIGITLALLLTAILLVVIAIRNWLANTRKLDPANSASD
jgi:hypothetical protein